MKGKILIILLFILVGCQNSNNSEISLSKEIQPKDKTEIKSDSVNYYNKYLLSLEPENRNEHKYYFVISKLSKGRYIEIFRDIIYSEYQKIEFEDYNSDNIKDILIQNTSDVRSNWTYNLYIVDTVYDIFRKIKGFEKIKSPKYDNENQLIINYVVSGKDWTSFYKIERDSIISYNEIVYRNADYDTNIKTAIENIKKSNSEKKDIKFDYFIPDTSVIGISIDNIISTKKILGNDIFLKGDTFYTFISQNKKQFLKVLVHPGGTINSIDEFIIGFSNKDMNNEQVLNFNEFYTGNGIKLGNTKEQLLKKIGCDFLIKQNENILEYRVEFPNDTKTKLLNRYNMPIYYAIYKLKKGKVNEIRFGFEYP